MKIKITYFEENNDNNMIEMKNHIAIYLLGIKIKKIKLEKKIHSNKNNNKNVNAIYMIIKQILRSTENKDIVNLVNGIIKSVKIHKLDMNLGINFDDPIINAYCIALINSILPLYLAKNSEKVNLKHTRYYTFIAEKVIHLNIHAVLSISIRKNLIIILKILFAILKDKIKQKKNSSNENKNGKEYNDKLSEQYG